MLNGFVAFSRCKVNVSGSNVVGLIQEMLTAPAQALGCGHHPQQARRRLILFRGAGGFAAAVFFEASGAGCGLARSAACAIIIRPIASDEAEGKETQTKDLSTPLLSYLISLECGLRKT